MGATTWRVLALLTLAASLTSSCTQRVSYGRQIAPVFALHCNGCHGSQAPSSAFRTNTYKDLRSGGVLGDDIVPGDPNRSMVVKFIEGFRGPDQRMPLGATPLTADQIGLIRRWILNGAPNDHATTPCYEFLLPSVPRPSNLVLNVSGQVSTAAYLTLLIRDTNHRTLYSEESSVKLPVEEMDLGAPGAPLSWRVNFENEWPAQVSVMLRSRYSSGPIEGLLRVNWDGHTIATQASSRSQCPSD